MAFVTWFACSEVNCPCKAALMMYYYFIESGLQNRCKRLNS